ncbi:uncharacterized protein PHACADRAFT_246673 [Phanerochaete carnosa HHB-10118-sp]|uniref:Uncharacterized protein n=1 Tax=Phanerochaete carnosa (strain HHB-10118-sp) TaxID=650164 RepID=K5WN44_PHACS|nr:uncharacterized protein PHACADRAFT_246673 [Phanerochaete carnosa HHB-10118-sp]EKM60639.1 hypothetical protein PHACADRAFT_246673 [Phanerochaete carnosa HHB-10118-sp]
MESVAYGIFLVTFGLCVKALLCVRDQLVLKPLKDVNWGMFCVAVLMLIFATFDVAFGLRHNLDAFIFYTGPGGPTAEFQDLRSWINIMKTVDFVAQTSIGDAILIYRCWMIYAGRIVVILFPIALWLTTLVAGAMMIWVENTTERNALIEDPRVKPWLDTITACTLLVNVLVTSLIVWRIWRVRSKAAAATVHPHRLSRLMRIILDSGLLYTVCVVIFFGTTLAGSNAQYGVSDVVVQVIGITFNLIIIRVNNGTAAEAKQFTTTSGALHSIRSFPLRFLRTQTLDQTAFTLPVEATLPTEVGVEVSVSQHRDEEDEDERRSITKRRDSWEGSDGFAV